MAKLAQKAQELEAKDWKSFPRNNGKFMRGHHYGPGRAIGARSKLTEEFLAVLHSDFEKHGVKAIAKVRTQFPAAYVRVIASLLPRDVNLNLSAFDQMTDDQIDRRLQTIKTALELRSIEKEQEKEKELNPTEPISEPALSLSSSVSD